MDIFLPIVLVIVFFILFSICGWCCKKKHQGVVLGQGGTPITVTNQPVNASPVVIPPYPIDHGGPQHPMPMPVPPPGPGFVPTSTYQGGYPPAPGGPYTGVYPPAGPHAGYPPPTTAGAPYPPQTAPPPSYHEAVSQHPPGQPQVMNEGYAKQAPYNPNY